MCPVCEDLINNDVAAPIIDTYEGRASSSNGYPFHNWYNFVLGYTPTFPEYMINRENITSEDCVLDPFVGSGTTQLVCKLRTIPSFGIDANDFMVFAAKQKLNWKVNPKTLSRHLKKINDAYKVVVSEIDWTDGEELSRRANDNRPSALDNRYISDKPLVKVESLRAAINQVKMANNYKDLFMFAVSAILVPVSNVKYGPGFGIGKIKDDADVIGIFNNKVEEMIRDLASVNEEQRNTETTTLLGDSRQLSKYIDPNSISLIITSPPYPGDHEYTKHSKLELIFNGFAYDLSSFRVIKKRMIRGSTTNIYKEDNEKALIDDIQEIKDVTDEIDNRLIHDGATSGFEKLYTRLIWEYFGGMASTLQESFKVLKPGGKIALLVSDSHAFKMVHIKTAELLQRVGLKLGYVNPEIVLWQMKNSTSHKYQLRENILILQKPEERG